jgi:hypothetical protein
MKLTMPSRRPKKAPPQRRAPGVCAHGRYQSGIEDGRDTMLIGERELTIALRHVCQRLAIV